MENRRPTLCVVAGPNGSGKTTTTIQLLNNEWAADSLYINPDNIAQETFGDWNSPNAILKAAEEATRLRYECLEQGRDFVFETVFSAPEKVEFLRKAKDGATCKPSSSSHPFPSSCSLTKKATKGITQQWKNC